MDTKNKEEIVRILASSEDNLQGAFTIFENNGALKNYLIANYFNPQLKEIADELHIKVSSELIGRGINAGFSFEVPEWSFFNLEFEFDAGECKKLGYFYNLKNIDRTPVEAIAKLSPKFEKKNDNKRIPCGFSYKIKYSDWNSDAYIAIYSGKMKDEIKRIVIDLLKWAEELEM